MFERFDESARRALFLARAVATEHGCLSIDESHLAAGVLDVMDNTAWKAFGGTTSADEIDKKLLGVVPSPAPKLDVAHIPFADGCRRALERAEELADRHHHQLISRTHLLAGVVEANGSNASRV